MDFRLGQSGVLLLSDGPLRVGPIPIEAGLSTQGILTGATVVTGDALEVVGIGKGGPADGPVLF